MAIIYTKLKKDAHCTDSDPLYTTQIYNRYDNVTGVSRKIEILATVGDEAETEEEKAAIIQVALEVTYEQA